MNQERLAGLLEKFSELRLGVVGDFFLDKYLVLDPQLSEPSLETGLEAYQVVEERTSPGAAGTVASNLSALEIGGIYCLTIIGRDGAGFELKRELRDKGIDLDCLVEIAGRFTPTYIKPMRIQPGGGEIEMNRQDLKNRTPTPPQAEAAIIRGLRELIVQLDGVVVVDQVTEHDCGVITAAVRSELETLAQAHSGTVFLCDSRSRIGHFRNLTAKANQFEAVRAMNPDHQGDFNRDLARSCARRLAQRSGAPIFLTLGGAGISVFEEGEWTDAPTISTGDPVDTVGAGDAATAGIISALCAGATGREAAVLGNVVASITVQQLGTTGSATREQVVERFLEFQALGIT